MRGNEGGWGGGGQQRHWKIKGVIDVLERNHLVVINGTTLKLTARIVHQINVDHGSPSPEPREPQFLGKNYHTPSNFQKLPQQLSIWIFMPHRSDDYKKVAFRRKESPTVVRWRFEKYPCCGGRKRAKNRR